MYYERLSKFVKTKGLKQKEFAEMMGTSANMISRYLNGTADFSAEFIMKLSQNFPDINLNEIFANDSEVVNMVNEPEESYNYNVINEIEKIENQLSKLKEEVKKKNNFDINKK